MKKAKKIFKTTTKDLNIVFNFLKTIKKDFLGLGMVYLVNTLLASSASVLAFLYGIGRADMYSNLAGPLLVLVSMALAIVACFNGFASAKAFKKAFCTKRVRRRR